MSSVSFPAGKHAYTRSQEKKKNFKARVKETSAIKHRQIRDWMPVFSR